MMAAICKHWRESATLILATSSRLSPAAATVPRLTTSSVVTSSGSDPVDNFNVLLLKRSSNSKFMPNLHVFPGGVAVNNDFSSEWVSIFRRLGSDVQQNLFQGLSTASSTLPMFSRQREPHFSIIPPEVAFRICAIRETFEESGVLLALPTELSKNRLNSTSVDVQNGVPNSSVHDEDTTVLNIWRKRVNENPDEFLNMCRQLDLIPEIWALYEWSNWLTPEKAEENQCRFDTAFFVCCVDSKPNAVHDAGETVSASWSSPSALLTAYYEQKCGLAPPQLYELSRLLNFKSAGDLLKFVAQPGRSKVSRTLTNHVLTKDYVLHVLPGDDLYPKKVDQYSKETYQKYEGSLDELSKKYSNHHRLIFPLSKGLFHVQCTIQPGKGQVYPNTNILNSIKLRAKL